MTLENTIKQASELLKNHNIASYELDAEIILSDIMGVAREFLIVNDHTNVSKNIIRKYSFAIKRRINREPVAYITGKKEFWSENFTVNNTTLVPRPETEILIYKVINYYKNKTINILDIGTGSGCILLSILKELNFSRGIGIDISAKAIEIAKINSKNLNLLNKTKFEVCDLNKFSKGKYDLIVSNPPYIKLSDIGVLDRDIKFFEPNLALNGGLDGYSKIRKVINKSSVLIKKDGKLILEIGFNQVIKTTKILKTNGFYVNRIVKDFSRINRCIVSTKL